MLTRLVQSTSGLTDQILWVFGFILLKMKSFSPPQIEDLGWFLFFFQMDSAKSQHTTFLRRSDRSSNGSASLLPLSLIWVHQKNTEKFKCHAFYLLMVVLCAPGWSSCFPSTEFSFALVVCYHGWYKLAFLYAVFLMMNCSLYCCLALCSNVVRFNPLQWPEWKLCLNDRSAPGF